MRQLITRIDDDLHARIKAAAQVEGRSVNALVIEALQRATGTTPDPRDVVRQRARDAMLLVVPPRPVQVVPREQVIEATRGAGKAVGEALTADRDRS